MFIGGSKRSCLAAVQIILSCLFICLFTLTRTQAQVSILTRHNDLQRTGQNLSETILTPANVNVDHFGKLYSRPLDGELYTQPLYVPNVAIPGKGTHNVVYLATAHNTVYAFDADSNVGANAVPLWQINFGPSVPSAVIPTEVLPVEIGIIGTPVIDPVSKTLYVAAKTYFNENQNYSLHAIDITTGAEKPNSPVTISATAPGTADGGEVVSFVPEKHLQRPALTLVGNTVYVAFASHEDYSPYHGWIMAYDATTLALTSVHCNTPNGDAGGIWMSGEGLTADGNNNLYYVGGNGDYDGAFNFGESILKLSPALSILDWFTPFDFNYLNSIDFDLGSSGSIGIPNTNLLVSGGKNGKIYLLNTDNMGKFQAGSDNQVVQWFQACAGHIHSSMLYYESPTRGRVIYAWGENDYLKAWTFNGSLIETTAADQSAMKVAPGYANGPGMSITANGHLPNTGILWSNLPLGDAVHAQVPGILRAFDASNLSNELWNSQMNANRDDVGNWAKWVPPTVANGKVYLATLSNQLDVYGLLSAEGSLNLSATPGDKQATLSWQAISGATSYNLKRSLVSGGPYAPVASGLNSTNYTDSGLTNGTTYFYVVTLVNGQGESGPSNEASATPSASANLATFLKLDTTTKGSWKGVYGADGYMIQADATSLPTYAQISVNDASQFTWLDPTTELRAVEKSANTERIAACWYSDSNFNVDVNFTDGQTHQLALYGLDWDANNRIVLFEALDGTTGAVLDSRSLAVFDSGKYLVWNVKGHVKFRLTNVNSTNAVLSGIFLGGASSLPPPAPPTGLAGTPGDRIGTLSWQPSAGASSYNLKRSLTTGGPYASVKTGAIATTVIDTGLTNGTTYYYVATAVNANGESGNSNEVALIPQAGANVANFVKLDADTKGSWKGVYGSDGYLIQADGTSLPAFAQISVTDANSYTWVDPTTDIRALEKSAITERIAACWYTGQSLVVDVNLTDGLTHQLALYGLDWDANNRNVLYEALDSSNDAVLDSRTMTAFDGGQYFVWNVKGHVKFRLTNAGSTNAVLSGIFLGGGGSLPAPSPPTGLTAIAGDGSATLSWQPSTGANSFNLKRSLTPGGPYVAAKSGLTVANIIDAGLTNGTTYYYVVTAVNSNGESGNSNEVSVTPQLRANSASFLKLDATTQGSWKGVYGADGVAIQADSTALPAYAQLSFTGETPYTWIDSTNDAPALMKANAPDRIAACWYANQSFTADVNLTDGNAHQVALYCLDWDFNDRNMTIDVLDSTTGEVLDTKRVSGFEGGQYLVWNVKGHVKFRFTSFLSSNVVLSGVFFR